MPRSPAPQDGAVDCDGAYVRFVPIPISVGTRLDVAFAAQWLAYTTSYKQVPGVLADADAPFGPDIPSSSWGRLLPPAAVGGT